MADLGIKNPTLGAIQISIFVLAFALGPIFAAPLSEIYGRTMIVRTCNILFIAFSIGSGFAQNAAQLAVCRFFAGVGGSGGLAVFGGVLADIWDLKERAKASALMSTLLILGPVVGPACGGWISERASWRWTCWVPAMAAAALEIISLIHMKESYIPILLERKLQRNKRLHPDMDLYTVVELLLDLSTRRAGSFISSAIRPVIYLLVDPVLFLLSLYFAFVFGEVYLLIVTFPDIFGDGYGHSAGFVGIDLLAQGVGNILGLIATVKAHGIIYERQTRPDKRYNPESRLVPAFPGALLIVAGLFLYGFSALKYHFIVPLVGFVIFAAGAMNIFLAIQLYIVDCFAFPASAVASLSFLRFVFAGVFPLFGPRLFQTLGVDWGTGLLAFLSLGLGLPFLPLIYIFGKKLREIGKYNMRKITSH
ncbi:MFS membrane transporter [Histoplasma capsulatum G186AR]|uniref:MFS membrane transporter n=1 Tax=Ajellomyces capsulatus TaxID=5037 RepID=A0A8H7YCI5_AJECA|nr:MFS membrane transporter [Histoplasma capsulatum]QSS71302.1 MFS membrane transporter [Histoplasma capsulatum G186AR]